MPIALTRAPAPTLVHCELTYLERTPIDFEIAQRQHVEYCDALRETGARVVTLPALNKFPDSVFVEDNAIVFDECAVLTPMGAGSRRGEMTRLEPELARYRAIKKISPPAQIEGGDVIRIGKTVYVGLSTRTNPAGAAALAEIVERLGYRVVRVLVRGCLHLKTGCTPLDDETIIANPAWVDLAPFADKRVVTVPRAEPWAGNVLRANDTVLIPAECSQSSALVQAAGYRVRAVALGEFMKAEAGLTCMSLLFDA